MQWHQIWKSSDKDLQRPVKVGTVNPKILKKPSNDFIQPYQSYWVPFHIFIKKKKTTTTTTKTHTKERYKQFDSRHHVTLIFH